jgi:hypothetical protein
MEERFENVVLSIGLLAGMMVYGKFLQTIYNNGYHHPDMANFIYLTTILGIQLILHFARFFTEISLMMT